MTILVDSNIWLRSVQPNHPQCNAAKEATASLWSKNHILAVSPQVLYEFWVVATRPIEANGLGLAPDRAEAEIDSIANSCQILYDDRQQLDVWRELVVKRQVKGKLAHDARLVAAMLRHGVTHLLTFNAPDFARFAEITVVSPEAATTLPMASE